MSDPKSCKNMCFTLNNYTDDDLSTLNNWKTPTYIVYGFEVGESGTPHLQGYFEFKSSTLFKTIKKILPSAHLEQRKGTGKQASDYCKKDGKFIERGEMKNQGERNDIKAVQLAIKNGASELEICEEFFAEYCKYHKAFTRYKYLLELQKPRIVPKIIWLYGETGTGKTRAAVEWGGKDMPYYMKDTLEWWDGYMWEPKIIIDDFCTELRYRTLLKITDRYKFQGPVKGGYLPINSPYIFITCDRPPDEIYRVPKELAQIERRIHLLHEVTKNDTPEGILKLIDKNIL